MHLPEAERASEFEAVWLDEGVFRAGRNGVEDAVAAMQKVYENRAEVAARFPGLRGAGAGSA